MNPFHESLKLNRRAFFTSAASGLGAVALNFIPQW